MKLSIIIPVYNVYAYLEECVRSVLPIRADFEVLLVDDGSTDQSGELCDRLAQTDGRIRVIHRENGGLSAARNTGIREARGEYLLFLDSDDFLDAEATERMLTALDADPDVAMGLYRNYYAGSETFENENGDGFLTVSGPLSVDEFLAVLPPDGQSCYMIAPRFVVRREMILANDLFFCEGIYHEDEEWTARLFCLVSSVYVTHEYFYQYRQARDGAITQSVKPKHLRDLLVIMDSAKKLLSGQEDGSERARYLKNRISGHFLHVLIHLPLLKGEERTAVVRTLTDYKPLCQPHLCGKIGRIARRLLSLFGVRTTAHLLHAAYKTTKALKR